MTELPLVVDRRPARRAEHGAADQDRTGGFAAGALWAERGMSDSGDRRMRRRRIVFRPAFEAFTIATKYMTPVVLLSDGYIANGAEPWLIPDVSKLPKIEIRHPQADGTPFMPYRRDEHLVRPWALPGTPGLEHRIGGLEKQDVTGRGEL